MNIWVPPPRISNDCKCRGVALDSASCGAFGVDAGSVDLARDWRHCKESELGDRNRRRVGRLEPDAPPTASEGWLGGAGLSATWRHPSRLVPREGGPSAGPLGRGELLVASSSPHYCHARPSAASTMMTLPWRGETTTRTAPTCHSCPPPR
jgi:hypothetical protein